MSNEEAGLERRGLEVPPRDFHMILPDGWFRIGLESGIRERSIASLVERQFQGIDDAPVIKQELRNDMIRRAEKAFENGGIELYLSLQPAGPLTVPASLLVTLAPLDIDSPLSPDDLARSLAEDSPSQQEVSLGELQTGAAVRVRGLTKPPRKDVENGYPTSFTVDYYLPVPDTNAYLLLNFSTPLEALADEMSDLFDAMADSLNWVD